MLTQVEIEGFQSIRELSLELGRFTVVTGPTGSGKSAVLRALRLLTFNARGTSYISRGGTSCRVQAGLAEHDIRDGWSVGIERKVSGRGDCYALAPLGDAKPEMFTKLAGAVPDQVTAALQLSELNFASQFGRPFLLDSSGGEVARVLGKLTNVTVLFEAAREAERRRREIMGDLRRAEANLAGLAQEAQRFRGMRDRQAAAAEAQAALERAEDIETRLTLLGALTDRLETAQAALQRATPPEVPDSVQLEELAAKLTRLRALYRQFDTAVTDAAGAKFATEQASLTEQAAHEQLHQVLTEAGQCPTCGQEVSA